jgi:excisionase family DNA binding protein
MTMHTVEVEVARRGRDVDVDELEAVLERLQDYHASLGTSPRGWLSALVSLPAESVAQAASTAAAVVSQAIGADVVAIEAMTAAEFDQREGFEKIPDLVGASDAAQLLGVSRQAVQQMTEDGRLPSTRVGNALAIPRAAVDALRDRRAS